MERVKEMNEMLAPGVAIGVARGFDEIKVNEV